MIVEMLRYFIASFREDTSRTNTEGKTQAGLILKGRHKQD